MLRILIQSFLLASIVASSSNAQNVDLSVLGENSWIRFKPSWSLTVNDQCLYEFVFQFEHDDTLPIGEQNFQGKCAFKDPETKEPFVAPEDNKYYLDPRKFWERFPDYVWATIGFNHMSLEWLPCGKRPRGYSKAQYDFSFFRVTPEFRAQQMTCKLLTDAQVVVPGEQICDFNQGDNIKGMGFFIVPGALINRNPVVNMPETFRRPKLGNGPIPHVGLRSWDQDAVPETPNQWDDLPLIMSTYGGDLVMWQANVPYDMVSGENRDRVTGSADRFEASAARYFQTTVQTLPDTFAVDYDDEEGMIRFIMVGKSQLCRSDFESAEAANGGPPIFPYYGGSATSDGDEADGSTVVGSAATGRNIGLLSLTMTLSLLGLIRW